MRTLMVAVVSLLAAQAFGAYQMGETLPNLCWQNVDQQTVCLDDFKDTVRVIDFNAGWCPPCNEGMKELSSQSSQFKGKPVTFISLSFNGWTHGSEATPQFLREWKQRHNIPFVVAATKGTQLKDFFPPPNYIPAIAIVDRAGKLAYREVNPSIDQLFAEVRRLMGADFTPIPMPTPVPLP